MQAKRFKLFHSPAVRSSRVKWLLHELLDDDFDVEVISLYDAVQYSDAYLKINPNHAVPVLEITMENDDVVQMIESGAMITLLADTHPEKHFAPRADCLSRERADYLQMLSFGTSSMDMMLWQIRIHEHILPTYQRDARTVRRYRNKFALEVEPQLKSRLSQTAFVCGEKFTAADCVIGHNVLWAQAYALCSDAVFTQYIARLSQRPAFARAFADLNQFVLALPEENTVSELFTG